MFMCEIYLPEGWLLDVVSRNWKIDINSDMHLKNFSMIETNEASSEYVLSPAYDLLPVNIIMPEDDEECALALNGKKSNLKKEDFISFAESCDVSKTSAEKMIGKIVSMEERYTQMCRDSLVPGQLKNELIELIEKRCTLF